MSDFLVCSLCGAQGTEPSMKRTIAGVVCPICLDEAHRPSGINFIAVSAGSGPGAPELHLVHGRGQRIRVYAQLVEPQPKSLPAGLVLIELPHNCYIDPADADPVMPSRESALPT